MYSIIRRGPNLVSKVLEYFDFDHPIFIRLVERRWCKVYDDSLREVYVAFAISFLEVGNNDMSSIILRTNKLYSGVFHWLIIDQEFTLFNVLTTMRDKVLLEDSLLPPSSLFQTVSLQQLIYISGVSIRNKQIAELAFQCLALACTNPYNELMSDLKRI